MSCLENIGKQIIKSLIQLQRDNRILNDRRKERYKEIESYFDAKKNTDKRMHTQSTTEIQTSLTEDRTLLDKEEEAPGSPHEKTQTDEKIPDT